MSSEDRSLRSPLFPLTIKTVVRNLSRPIQEPRQQHNRIFAYFENMDLKLTILSRSADKIVTASTSSLIRVHQCFVLVANNQQILPQPSHVVKLSWSGSQRLLFLK